MRSIWLIVAVFLLGATACGSDGGNAAKAVRTGSTASSPASPTPSVSHSQSSPPRHLRNKPRCDRRSWSSSLCQHPRISAGHGVLTKVQAAKHNGYDRVTFTFDASQPLPGYVVRYVPEVIKDPSEKKVKMPGHAYLEISFSYARSLSSKQGLVTLLKPNPNRPVPVDLHLLRAYVMTSDHHGRTDFVLGLENAVDFRVRNDGTAVLLDLNDR
ncbi:hypothetical protein ACGFNU_47720 [Spirillospora sp. NPDC048911]|uniref:AMIN-like domain-containing (lipo)protein n=1 Tax=Spirillospora sp. NPDC048911 TaxID=3364527 RepID=UPI0037108657